MIKNLTAYNDKIAMISLIKNINNKIESFFNQELKVNNININGYWGWGKSTIVNNLEQYYENKGMNIQWVIINLWEYETTLNPYMSLVKDILLNIVGNKHFNVQLFDETKKNKIVKWFLNLSFNIPYTDINVKVGGGRETQKMGIKDLDTLTKEAINEIKDIIKNDKKNIVLIFDELDRCTLDNQIKFLSYIKNMFLQISNVFYIISANNDFINSNARNNYNSQNLDLKLEDYTNKIFDLKIDLKHIFNLANSKFTENECIHKFLCEMKENNPRLISNLLYQVKKSMISLENDKDFNDFIKNKNEDSYQKRIIWKWEFIIFYCYYLKNKFNNDYSRIINFVNTYSINHEFFSLINSHIFSAFVKSNFGVSDEKKFNWSLNKEINIDEGKPTHFNLKFNKKIVYYLSYPVLIPFFWFYINENNIDNIFQNVEHGKPKSFYSDKQYITFCNLDNINFDKNIKCFLNILFKEITTDGRVYNFQTDYSKISKIIKNTVFDY